MGKQSKYYNWDRIFSYNAYLNLIVTARGKGKTYGLRKQFIRDYKKDRSRFVEVCRYDSQMPLVMNGYFDKLIANGDAGSYIFKYERECVYIAEEPLEGEKAEWELMGYFVALSKEQQAKRRTFANVKRMVFDEFILEPGTRPGYLSHEYRKLVNLIDTVAREQPGEDTQLRVYMLSNACDLINPYFTEFGITSAPKYGYTWLQRGDVLLHYDDDPVYTSGKRETLAGRLSRGNLEDMITNVISNAHDGFIAEKPRSAKHSFTFLYEGEEYSVWRDWNSGTAYVNGKTPSDGIRYALSMPDMRPNVTLMRRTSGYMRTLSDMVYNGCVYWDTPARREGFTSLAKMMGVR